MVPSLRLLKLKLCSEFQFLRDYDSSVTRRSEIIDFSTSRVTSDSLSESVEDTESLMTIRSYRDSQKQRKSAYVTLPKPTILLTTTDSVSFFPVETEDEQRKRTGYLLA